ncbi:MAG: polysaccharide biosynthesis/export family protein [Parachlamydia sp.]|nr:polysaccharide biosynthesis/export family protein [Parachlamydia sp.]
MPALLLLFLIALSSCSSPCCDYDILGADEFVIDSYKIRQGKLAILEMEGIDVEELPCDAMEEYKDVIAEDDLLNIVIFHPTRKDLMGAFQSINQSTGGFKVTRGRVDIPDVDSVEVAGLTLDEAKEKIQGRFRDHIKDVEVFVNYKDRLKSKVELAGLVQTPTVPVDGKIRLYEVLAKAKMMPQANLFMSYVVRNGKPMALDLHQLVNQGDMSQNVVMHGGDKIFIANPSDATVMMMGEVGEPRPINLPYGYISLREALVIARGIPYTGDRNCIQVIRGNLQCPKIYILSWKHIIHLPNDSLLLMPGDTVYVSAKPITEWNQFISQLFPSMQGLQTGYTIYNLVTD